jgi:hypothetical protein
MGNQYGEYDGLGLVIEDDSDSNNVINCTFYNAGQQAFTIRSGSDGNEIEDCRVYCDDDFGGVDSATHYYFILEDGTGNLFARCEAERRPDPVDGAYVSHGGHGFVIQADTDSAQSANQNYVDWCSTKNIAEPFVLRGRVTENEFVDCSSILTDPDDPKTAGCITLYSGPYANEFHRVRLVNSKVAIGVFGENYDDEASLFPANSA